MFRVPDVPSWYSIKHLISSRNIFHSKCSATGSCLGIEWPYRVPHYPKVAGLIERWSGLLKTQSWCQLRNNTVKGWSSILQSGVYAFNQRLLHSIFFFFPITRIKEQKQSWLFSLLYLITACRFVASLSGNFGLCWFGDFSTQGCIASTRAYDGPTKLEDENSIFDSLCYKLKKGKRKVS